MPRGRLDLRPKNIARVLLGDLEYSPSWHFVRDVARLIWESKWFSLAIFVVTIFQEYAALVPVNLLGQFIDRLGTGDMGNTVWLFLLSTLFYPALMRGNVMLRHKMFYEMDYRKNVEMVLKAAEKGDAPSPEAAGAAFARTANAVSGITNAVYHVLGSFTPIIIKIIIVSINLVAYNRLLGQVYVASLLIPAVMTIVFNRWLRVLLDSQYSVASEFSGAGVRTFTERGNEEVKERFRDVMRVRRRVHIHLVIKGQFFIYLREAALIGSQFIVVFMAVAIRTQLGLTPGDFAKIIGYTTQVAAAFIGAASCLDAIISYSRAYHVYATGRRDA